MGGHGLGIGLSCVVRLAGWDTLTPLGWESTPPTRPDWEPIHLMVQGGHHPNAWTRGGYLRQLLCVAGCAGWAGLGWSPVSLKFVLGWG